MLTGVLGAVASSEMRTIFSFHIVSQIGYMIMPLAFPSAAALSAGVFYVIHHILVKSNLFFISGLVARAGGSSDLTRIRGGLLGTHHGLALFFAIPAASLAGIPPLSGFWAKLVVIDIGLQAHQGALVTIALITSALTLFSMTKIWQAAFWGEARSAAREETPRSDLDPSFDVPAPRVSAWSYTPVVVLALLTVSIGLWPEPLLRLTTRAGIELTDHTDYIDAVMRTRP
jgi:multicomponent Na+:H+ antiporter subunit D